MQWHSSTRRRRSAAPESPPANDTKGDDLRQGGAAGEVSTMFEALYEAQAPAELEGAVLNVTDNGRIAGPGEAPAEALQYSAMARLFPSPIGDGALHVRGLKVRFPDASRPPSAGCGWKGTVTVPSTSPTGTTPSRLRGFA